MKALCIDNNQPVLKIVPLPEKESEKQILVKVHSMGLNRADLLQAEGLYPSSDSSNILGLELAGIREDNGEGVCALVNSGAFAEYVYVYPEQILPVPYDSHIDLTRSAALPEALLTCWFNMFELGKLAKQETVLIHGGSSGIGSIAIQLAKAYDCKIITTVGSEQKKEFCIELGADSVLNYQNDDYVQIIKSLGGVIFILDILGGEHFARNISCLKSKGRIALIAVMSGNTAQINLGSVLMKNITIFGTTLRSQPLEVKANLINSVVKNVYPLLQQGRIKPKIDIIYNFENYQDAFYRMKSRMHMGKILLIF